MEEDKSLIEKLMTGGRDYGIDPDEKQFPAWLAYLLLGSGGLVILAILVLVFLNL